MSKILNVLFFLGRPFAPIYGATMIAREKLYETGLLVQCALPVPVVSVGNLMLGGTGKTPTVEHLSSLLVRHGYKPAVISRGHGGKAKNEVNVVSDGQNVLLSAIEAGDEPYMLAESLPGVPVLTGVKRIIPCRHAIDHFDVDILILDDGFQHLSVKRDINIVLFDSSTLAGNSRVFPGGPLREPVSALKRCDAFLLTGKTASNHARSKQFSELLVQRFPDKPVYSASLVSPQIIGPDGSSRKLTESVRYFGFCGIANPARFEQTIKDLQLKLVFFYPLDDHQIYKQSLVSTLCDKALQCGADRLITTQKDAVKLRKFKTSLPIFVLKMKQNIEKSFDDFIVKALQK